MHSVQRIRLYVTLAVRMAAVILLLVGVYGVMQWIPIKALGFSILRQEGERGSMWLGVAIGYLLAASLLAVVSSRLVRWSVPANLMEHPLRLCIVLTLRLFAVALLLVALYGIVQFTCLQVQALVAGWSRLPLFHRYDRGFTWEGFALGYLAAGLALALLSGRLARWMTPDAKNECPRCAYELENLTTGRCPECGLDLTEGAAQDRSSPAS